jgi:hypothetical protein
MKGKIKKHTLEMLVACVVHFRVLMNLTSVILALVLRVLILFFEA